MKEIKTLLIYPPQALPFRPYSSLPSLTGFLRAQGYQVEQRDVNIEAHDALLASDRLRRAEQAVVRRLADLEQRGCLSEREQKQAETLFKARTFAPYVIDHVEEARQAMRDPAQFYDLERCLWAGNVLTRGMELLSAEYYPTKWTWVKYRMRHFNIEQGPALEDLLQAARDEEENIFLSFLRREVLPSILEAAPDLVGLSVTYWTQIIPALTLVDLIKQAAPSIYIFVGGARACYDPLWTRRGVFSIIDSVVVGEGEHALLALVQKLEREDKDLSDVPNLIYLSDGKVQHNTIAYLEDVNESPTPDWIGLPLDLYFSPDFVPLLPTNRGCYWGRCAFCDTSRATSGKYRPRRIDLVLKDMQTLYERHGATHFFLSCDAEPPRRMEKLAAEIEEKGLPFVWQCETRLSPSLTQETCQHLFEGGCRYLIFGFESACQRVLDLMDKGTKSADFGDILRNCNQAGIGVNLQTFLGFPTETREEARMTVDFVAAHQEYIDSVSICTFKLLPLSKVDLEPSRYSVIKVEREAWSESDFIPYYDYQIERGMSQHEVAEQLEHHLYRLRRHFPDFLVVMEVSNLNAFLYVSHYGNHVLKSMVKAWFMDMDDLLDAKPRVSSRLDRYDFCFNGDGTARTVLFSPVNASVLTVDAQVSRLLDMCDGRRSSEEIATEFAAGADATKGFVAGYSQALDRLKRFCENGFLEIGP